MCGILGVISLSKDLPIDINDRMNLALNEISYRGPDGNGIATTNNYSLGHVRLSIIDLTNAAAQPMQDSETGSCISYNGEIYNYVEHKRLMKAQGMNFKSTSDTEVLLKLIESKGAESFNLLNGMFAFAYVNNNKKQSFLVRDKYGIKPLYYTVQNDCIFFSSTVSALVTLTGIEFSINQEKILEYLYYGSTLGSHGMINGIFQLEPGCYIDIDLENGSFLIKRFHHSNTDPTKLNDLEICKQSVKSSITSAVERQLRADVPVGLFLSGGIDSTIIAWAASQGLKKKINTYSARFDFSGDEDYLIARETSKFFNTNHHEFSVTEKDIPYAMQELASVHSSPLGDYADIPLFLMSKEVSKSTKVVLQGDGGDELFAGYKRYKTLSKIDRTNSFFRSLFPLFGLAAYLLPSNLYTYKRYLHAVSSLDWKLYAKLMSTESVFKDPALLLANKDYSKNSFSIASKRYKELSEIMHSKYFLDNMLLIDMKIVLPDIFFRKVDGATMAASIESRVPFLDDDIVKLSESIPTKFKINGNTSKWILKETFMDFIPSSVIHGRKKGFTVPVGIWLKSTLKDFFWESISNSNLNNYLDIKRIDQLYAQHLKGHIDNSQILWRVLCLSLWLKANSKRGIK